jgi:hypothetical protein
MNEERRITRKQILTGFGASALGLLATSAPGRAHATVTRLIQDIGDGDILTFALNLEYLEAEFYSMATTGRTLGDRDTGGKGSAGATTGGQKVPFANPELAVVAREIARDELEHVRFLRSALGDAAVAKPAINLDALGVGFKNDGEFVAVARAFEDVGVSAYRGAAKLIQNKDYLDAAAGILATEAYHAGNIRAHAIYGNYSSPKLDGIDEPPTKDHSFPTDKNGLVPGRTPGEVGMIVRGSDASGGAFFPSGLNGKIR